MTSNTRRRGAPRRSTGVSRAGLAIIALQIAVSGAPATVPVTITTNPASIQVIVDKVAVNTPAVLAWVPGTTHTIEAPQQQAAGATAWIFNGWRDSSARVRALTAP